MTEHDHPEAAAPEGTDAGPKLQLQKIYIKDSSFESPNSPQVFMQQEGKPTLSLNLNSTSTKIADNTHEVVLSVSVEAKMGDSLAFLIEVQQAGIFNVEDCEVEEHRKLVGKRCPAMLYPYVCEAISNLAGKGGFHQLLLQPLDFDDLYLKAEQSPPPPQN